MGQITTRLNTHVGTRLETDLTPATDRQIFDELEALFLAFNTDAERMGTKRVALYIDACRGEPVWAVRKGIASIRNGHDGGKTTDFVPATMRLSRAVRAESGHARAMADRAARARKLVEEQRAALAEMTAPREPISEENRKRIDAFLRRPKEGLIRPMPKETEHDRC